MTRVSFQIVHYRPDPTSDAAFPVAAIVWEGDRSNVILAPHAPDDGCLGGVGRSRFFHRLQQRLHKIVDSPTLPQLGPYCTFSQPSELPEGVGRAFVERLVRRWYVPSSWNTSVVHVSRKVEGRRWLETQRVAHLVRDSFQPGFDHGRFLAHAPALERVSQYVAGTKHLLLLEPLVTRPRIDEDITILGRRFGSYAAAINSMLAGPDTDLFIYALPGVSSQELDRARSAVSYAHAHVVDVRDTVQRMSFVDKIKAVASESRILN